MEVVERTGELDGQPVRWLERGGSGTPTLYLHDMPLDADAWTPFLAAERGPAVAVDLPGFGLSGKPGRLSYDLPFYDAWIERFLDWIDFERFHLVAHGTGAVGLMTAQRMPERLGRIVLIAPLPLLPGFRWHKLARLWRRPLAGQLAMGAASARTFRRVLPASLAQGAWERFDQGTQRATLRFHRAAGEAELAAAGAALDRLGAPTLVLLPDADEYFGEHAAAYAEAMPRAAVEPVAGAGHWPWLDQPDLVERVIAFLHVQERSARS